MISILRPLHRHMIAAALLVLAPYVDAQSVITVRAGSGGPATLAPGTAVAVPIVLDMSAAAGANVASLSASVQWGATRLTFDSLKTGTFGSVVANTANAAAGVMSFSVFDAAGTTGSVTLFTLYFTTTSGATSVSITPSAAGSDVGADILPMVRTRWLDACVAPGGLWGDVNGDGTVNIIDAQQLARATVGLSVANAAAVATHGDVTNDGAVNIIDAQQIARFTVGLSASARVNTSLFTPATATTVSVPHVFDALGGSFNPALELNPSALSVGLQAQLRPLARDASNVDVTSCAALTYGTSNSAVATVSANGLVSGVTPGNATITVTAGSATTTVPFTVNGVVTIAASVSPATTGSVTGTGSVFSGSPVSLIAAANAGYTFSNWTESGTVVSTATTYNFTATTARTLVANFIVTPAASTISLSANPVAGGTVTGGGGFSPGTSIAVSATPNTGYNFTNWTDAGSVVSTSASYSFIVSGNRTLVANFASTPVSITLAKPTNNQLVGDTATVSATVTGAVFSIASVSAQAGAHTVLLAKVGSVWTGVLNLAGLPRDTMTLVITGTDANGGTGTFSRKIQHDVPPVVTVTTPIALDVARPSIAYAATCSDDDPAGCASLRILVNGTPLVTGTGSISGTLSLGSYDGTQVDVVVEGTDSRGQKNTVTQTVFVESSTSLRAVAAVSGQVLDADATRVLYKGASPGHINIVNLSTPTDVAIPVPATTFIGSNALTPLGAIFVGGPTSTLVSAQLYDWRSGVLSTSPQVVGPLDVSGNYAIYSDPVAWVTLNRRDLTTGTDVTLSNQAGNIYNSVSADGSVAYWDGSYDIYWNRAGVTTRITNDDDAVRWNVYPATDGTNVVYSRGAPCCGAPSPSELVMYDGTTFTVLATSPTRASPKSGYQLNNGWIAFNKPDISGVLQLWTRSPAGVLRQVTTFANASSIEALGTDGTVVFYSAGTRYSATATGAPQVVGHRIGSVVWRAGDYLVLLGRTVWKIQ